MRLSATQFFVLLLLIILCTAFIALSGVDLSGLVQEVQKTSAPAPSTSSKPSQSSVAFDFPVTWAEVDAVMDGDTIRLRNGDKLRYIGVDTPEKLTKPPECFAKEATTRNRKLVEGKRVALRKDRSNVDRYGRLLRYVYLEDGRMVNELLVEGGYATALEYRPDTLFAQRFATLEQRAKKAGRGLWGKCEGK